MEKDEERKFRLWCQKRGYLCLKLKLATQRGFPDRTVITPEKIIFMEMKTPVGDLSPQQEYWLEELGGYSSCRVFVPRSCQEAIDFVLSVVTTKITTQQS